MSDLKTLSHLWIQVKRAENAAIEARRSLDEQIAALINGKDEGSQSEKIDGLKVTVTRSVTRKVDGEALQRAWAGLDPRLQHAFRWKPDVNVTAMRQLDAALMSQFASFVTTAPSKPTIKVEEI